jgi:prophage antirepressor-like protein
MSKEKNLVPSAFEFSATKQEVRSFLIEQSPYFIAKDICDILGLTDTNKALSKLDNDEKLTRKIFVSGQNRKMWLVNESGLYALVLRSNKPEAKTFRKWITSEVLPSIRKKGYYHTVTKQGSFIDARATPYDVIEKNNHKIRVIKIEDTFWFSLNDLHKAIGVSTDSGQAAKTLNAKETLAQKIWLFKNTHPAWFTTELGVQLILSGSRLLKSNQLKLEI